MRLACGVLLGLFAVAPLSAQTRPAPAAPKTAAPARSEWFYLPGPPEVVAGSMADQVKWSSDGRYLLAVRVRIAMRGLDDMTMEPSIVLWNAATRAATTVWRVESTEYSIGEVAWMSGTGVAFVNIDVSGPQGRHSTVWRIDARHATAAQVAGIGPEDRLSVSPRMPYAVLYGKDETGSYLRTLDPTGQLGPKLNPAQAILFPMGWSPDGSTLYLPGVPGEERVKTFWAFRPGTGEMSSMLEIPKFAEPVQPKVPFRLDDTATTQLAGRPAKPSVSDSFPWGESKLRSLWLVQGQGPDEERILVAPDIDRLEISPRGDAVAYTNREGCFVVPFIRVDRAVMAKAREAAQRAMLLSNGKQVALAMLMYAMDNDKNYPPAGSDVRSMLDPYAKTQDIFNGLSGPGDGFVYTFQGGPMSGIKDPVYTEMGFIPAPGGRVVVYIDGHVKFLPSGVPSSPPSNAPSSAPSP